MRGRRAILGSWLLFIALAGLIVARARYSTDLSAFLPAAPNANQQLLVQLLRDGPTSQLLLVAIEGADLDTRARLSHELARQLRGNPAFTTIANGEESGFERDREVLFRHRYLISPAITAGHFSVAGLSTAMSRNLAQLGATLGVLGTGLLEHDPTGETQQIIEQLDTTSHPRSHAGVWVSAHGERAVLMVRTTAPGSDTDAQLQAIGVIRAAFKGLLPQPGAGLPPATLRLSGPGYFAAEARRTIQQEVSRLSALSTVLIGGLLLLVYRSLPLLLLGFLPVISGALAGIAAVALGFNVVYGITLGFGITLIGEAVDYSVYLFIQAARSKQVTAAGGDGDWTVTNWPTIRLGMLTSVCGFASLLPAEFPGLAQLGLYSVAGLVTAALVTRFVLPLLLPRNLGVQALTHPTRSIAHGLRLLRHARHGLWGIALLGVLALWLHRERLWNRELSALNPVPMAEQEWDGRLRADLGAPDVRELVIVQADDAQGALRGAEQVGQRLDTLVDRGMLAGYDTPSRYLPSEATQRQRRASLPEPALLRLRIAQAADAAGLRPQSLQPFRDDLEAARQGALLNRADIAGTTLAAGVDALLVKSGERWLALLPLRSMASGPHALSIARADLDDAVAGLSTAGTSASVLDLKEESDLLYAQYLHGALRLSVLALAAIALLLLFALRSAWRTLAVLLPLALAVLTVAAGFAVAGHALTILHLIGLLLIFAVGSNYALFFDRGAAQANDEQATRTLSSLLIANLTTVIAFGVLATSSVPLLAALGSTVAPGALLALLFSAMLARSSPHTAPQPGPAREPVDAR
jgi:predicted exporter